MSHRDHQEELVLTSEDFAGCGWKEVLAGSDREEYFFLSEAFFAAAKQAIDGERQAHGKVLSLLAYACSMRFLPDSFNEPFKPFTAMGGQHSIIPDVLSETDVSFFAQIVDEIDDPCPKVHMIKARLADLVWFLQSPRKVEFALAATDSYRTIPLATETWLHDGDKCWQRAINLARQLGAGAGERLAEMETSITEALTSVTRGDGFLGYWLADLLKTNSLGRDHSMTIATRLESLAREFDGEDEFLKARKYFRASAHWFTESGDDEKSTEMTVEVAETWVKEAVARLSSDQPSHRVAASFYESAIQTYRTIPRSERATHRVDKRIAELRRRLNEAGEKSLEEMGVIRTPDQDIRQIVENARNAVRGKGLEEALKAFVNLSRTNAKELREKTINNLEPFIAHRLFSTTFMSRDGRVTAKMPSMSSSSIPSDDDEGVIYSKMVENYCIHVRLAVQGFILPAQEVLLLEHRLREADFINLAGQSPIVPIGRELLFGKALFAGYDRDFVTALHILVPQIEHMVRYHLKQAGVQTTNIDSNGIENENGLSSLMDFPQTKEIFGEDLSFEIRALFCVPFGPNLRNNLAHGLLDDRSCYSLDTIYAWWLGLKLVFNTFWNALSSNAESKEQDEEQ